MSRLAETHGTLDLRSSGACRVLLVEDSADDARLMELALRGSGIDIRLRRVDGIEDLWLALSGGLRRQGAAAPAGPGHHVAGVGSARVRVLPAHLLRGYWMREEEALAFRAAELPQPDHLVVGLDPLGDRDQP